MSRGHIQLPPDGTGKAALAFTETEVGTPAPNAGVRYVQAFVPVDATGAPLVDGAGKVPVALDTSTLASQTTLAALLTELGQKLEPTDLAALSTAAKQDLLKTSVDAVAAKLSADPATQTTLAAVLTELGQKLEPADLAALATGAKQDTGNTALAAILAKLSADPATNTTLAAVLTKLPSDPATQTTLAAVLAKLSNDPATQTTLAAVLTKLSSDPATGAKQDTAQTRLNLLATEATTSAMSGKLGTPSSDDVLALLRSINTNTASEVTKTDTLQLTADQVNLNTDQVETKLDTVSTRIGTTGSPGTLAALLDAIRLNQANQAVQATLVGGADVTDRAARLLGHVSVDNFPASQAVTGPLTDAQLRAAAVPVSGTFWQTTQPVSGPLTDTQLRATAVPVSGTIAVSNFPTLTDTELPAAAALTDTDANPTVPGVGAYFMGWNVSGSVWKRVAVGSGGNLVVSPSSAASAQGDGNAFSSGWPVGGYIFNGTTWDRQRSVATIHGTTGTGLAGAGLLAFDGTNYSRLTMDTNGLLKTRVDFLSSSTMAADAQTALQVSAGGYLYNNSTGWNRTRDATPWINQGGTVAAGLTPAVVGVVTSATNFSPLASHAYTGDSTGSAMLGVMAYNYNGASADRQRGNWDGTALASAARTTAQQTASLTNYNGKGIRVYLNVTVASGTGGLSVRIQSVDPVSGAVVNLNTAPTAVTATGLFTYDLYPGATGGGVTQATSAALSRQFRLAVNVSDASSYTYSLGYSVIS